MRVRLLEPFEEHEKGSEVELGDGPARALIAQNRARPVLPVPTERAIVQPPEKR